MLFKNFSFIQAAASALKYVQQIKYNKNVYFYRKFIFWHMPKKVLMITSHLKYLT